MGGQIGSGGVQQEEVLVVVQCRVPEHVPLVQPQLLPVLQGEVHGHVLELLSHSQLRPSSQSPHLRSPSFTSTFPAGRAAGKTRELGESLPSFWGWFPGHAG